MNTDVNAYQTHWHPEELSDSVPATPDSSFILFAWDWVVGLSASAGQPGRVLDVACGNARHIVSFADLGWEHWGLDPSPLQLREARKPAEETGQRVNLVRGIAEFLPFKQRAFDSLICTSALDHFVDREGAMRQFAAVLRPKGRAVVSVNNYKSLSTRSSRLLYRLLRAVWPPARKKHLMWDSPVPFHHMYECTLDNSRALAAPYFDEVNCYGVSLLWGFPGWGRFLSLLPNGMSNIILRVLNKLARRLPRLADVVVFVWQPKEAGERKTADSRRGWRRLSGKNQ